MPTYEYVCRSCGHLFEIVQSMRDDALTECPECGGELRKVFAPPAISFKGSGFYATDQRKKAMSGSDKGDKSEKSDKGDTKPDAASAKGDGKQDSKRDAAAAGTTKKEAATTTSGSSPSSAGSSSSSSSKDGAGS